MNILPVAVPILEKGTPVAPSAPAGTDAGKSESFSDIFGKAMQNLNDIQLNADETVKKFLTGEVTDLHTVVIALEKAKLSMQLAVEVRNKLIEAYQEISRMQV